MRIAVIGHGNVGGALGRRWESVGYSVIYGVRDPTGKSAEAFCNTHGGQPALAAIPEALAGADTVLLATPFNAALELADAHRDILTGKVVIDATNPIGPGLVLTVGHDTSGAEQIATRALGARLVKAFNTYGWENFADAAYPQGKPVMFIAGDDGDATSLVSNLADKIGFEPAVVGGLKMARYLEPMAMLWIQMGRVQGRGSGFAWAMLQR